MEELNGVELSQHTLEKLADPISQQLGITPELLSTILRQPECIDSSDFPVLLAVGKLSESLSLCVVYKFLGSRVRVITFFPAKRGRYESKILPRG